MSATAATATVIASGLESVVATASAVVVAAIAAAEENENKENDPAVIASATHEITSFFSIKRLFISAFIDRICGFPEMCYGVSEKFFQTKTAVPKHCGDFCFISRLCREGEQSDEHA